MIVSCEWHGMCRDNEGIYPLYTVTDILVPIPSTCNEVGRQGPWEGVSHHTCIKPLLSLEI